MSATWTFTVVDAAGNNLTESGLALAGSKHLTFQIGAPNACTFVLPLTSQEAAVITPGSTYLKAYRQGTAAGASRVLQFYGPVWTDEIQAGASGASMLAVTAYDPSVYLTKRFTTYAGTADQGAILQSMIDTTNSTDGDTGIRTATANITTTASVTLDLTSQRPSIASIQQQFAGQQDGCESWIVPTELASGKMGDLYAALRKGVTRGGDIVFGYGNGTVANSLEMKRVRNMDNVENDITGYSDALSYNAIDLVSVAANRRLKNYVSMTGETNLLRLTARTLGRLADRYGPAGVAEYQIKPSTRAPVLFDDYDVGDTVWLDFNKGISYSVQQRVLSAQLDISNQGVEYASTIELRAP